jgi:uncharacterized protein (TIGR02266 family)
VAAAKIEMVLPVRFSVETRAVQTTTRELSEEGVFVRCLEPPGVGAQVILKIYLPGFSAAAEFVGLVREADATPASAGFWADFVSASHDAHERLVQVLRPDPAPKKSPPVAPVPLGSLYKRVHVSHPPPQGLPPPPAAPSGVPLPEENPHNAASGVAGLIQGALDEQVSQKAAEVLRARRGSSPGKKKGPSQPVLQAQPAAPASPPPAPVAVVSSASQPVPSSAPGDVSLAGDVGGKNRRTFPRYRARFAVRFQTVQDFVLEYAANISAGGVFVVTDFPPDMDSVITVVLELPDGGAPVTCKAQVVHRVSKEQAAERGVQAGAGVQFVEADDAFRERIDQTINQILDKVPA